MHLSTAKFKSGFSASGFPSLLQIENISLQIAHRLGAIGFLLALTSLVMVYLRHRFEWVVAGAFIASDIGFCAGLLAWMLARQEGRRWGEAYSTMIFNAIFLGLSLQLILLDRMDLIRRIANGFFSPG